MTEDERFNEYMRDALRDIDPPPPAPREEMWARIQARRAEAARDSAAGTADVVDIATRRPPMQWARWGAALAAMLVIGVGLGRVSMRQAAGPAPAQQQAVLPVDDAAADAASPYRLAAAQHMERTETLLTTIAVDAGSEGTDRMTTWARELLTDTRLLLSSPAADDPATRRLLEDLELLLSQVAAIPTARAAEEVQLIREGMNQSDVLLRLRAATTGPALVGT